jgi:Ni/Co efflux regulator RcnB
MRTLVCVVLLLSLAAPPAGFAQEAAKPATTQQKAKDKDKPRKANEPPGKDQKTKQTRPKLPET